MSTIYSTVGDTIEFDIEVVNADGEAVVLTGSTFDLTAKTVDGTHVITKTEVDGITISQTVGLLNVKLEPADTDTLTGPRNLIWDCRMTDTFGDIRTVARGKIALSMPV